MKGRFAALLVLVATALVPTTPQAMLVLVALHT